VGKRAADASGPGRRPPVFFWTPTSKTLIRPGDLLAAARRVPGAAQAVTGRIDMAATFARRDYMTGGIPGA
jgi:hypothetical protein